MSTSWLDVLGVVLLVAYLVHPCQHAEASNLEVYLFITHSRYSTSILYCMVSDLVHNIVCRYSTRYRIRLLYVIGCRCFFLIIPVPPCTLAVRSDQRWNRSGTNRSFGRQISASGCYGGLTPGFSMLFSTHYQAKTPWDSGEVPHRDPLSFHYPRGAPGGSFGIHYESGIHYEKRKLKQHMFKMCFKK